MDSYKKHPYWQNYQSFFPEHSQITDESMITEEWFRWKNCSIHLDRYHHIDPPKVTAILIHGAGGYGRMLAPIANMIYQSGYEVLAPDLPGYGLSRAESTYIDYQAWVDCLCDLVKQEYKTNPRPIILCGASVGGYLAYLCAAQLGVYTKKADKPSPIKGIIATTLADPRLEITKQQFAKNTFMLNVGMPLLPLFTKIAGRLSLPIKWFTKMNDMSSNANLVRTVLNDPLGGGNSVPISFMNSLLSVRPAIEPENFDLCPTLLAHPGDDKWTGLASSQHFFDRIKGPKSFQLLENCGHFPVETPGIMQLESSAKEFIEHLLK